MTKTFVRSLLAILISATVSRSARAQNMQTPQADESQAYTIGDTNSRPGFEVFASLLYLQPSGNNLEYATLVSPLPLPTPNWANQSIDPKYSPAFNVGLRYFFAESTNDIQVDWTHLDTSDNASVAANPNQFVGPSYEIGPDANAFRFATGSLQFEYDSVNLEVGHYLNAGDPVEVRVFGGLQFARIGDNVSANFRSADDLTTNGNTTDSLFTGVGPRMGINAKWTVGNFDLLGEMAGTVLVGTMKSRIDFSATSPDLAGLGIASPNTQALTSPDQMQVVPCVDCKLGGGYTLPVRNYGIFKIEGGYQAAVYFNAVSQYTLSDVDLPPAPQSVGVFLRTAVQFQSTVAVYGPYLKASWSF